MEITEIYSYAKGIQDFFNENFVKATFLIKSLILNFDFTKKSVIRKNLSFFHVD